MDVKREAENLHDGGPRMMPNTRPQTTQRMVVPALAFIEAAVRPPLAAPPSRIPNNMIME